MADPDVVYMVEPGDGCGYIGPFSTFGAALASVKEIADDEDPPSICRRRIDDHRPSRASTDARRRLCRNARRTRAH